MKKKKKLIAEGQTGRSVSAPRMWLVLFTGGKIEMKWTFAKQLHVQLRCGVTISCPDLNLTPEGENHVNKAAAIEPPTWTKQNIEPFC